MASITNRLMPWAAREASELASKLGITLEKAAEQIEEKYGQKVFKATAPQTSIWSPEEKIQLSQRKPEDYLGKPRGDDRSLSEVIGGKVLPAVEESAAAREASKYAEGIPARQRTVPAVESSITAREASRYTEGLPARQRVTPAVEESITAREASRYNEPDLPQYSREAGPEYRGIQRGFDPNAPMPPAGSLRAGLAAGTAGTAAIAGGMALRGAGGETSGAGSDAEKEQWKARKAEDYTRRQIPFTEEDLERQWNQTQQTRQSSLKSAIQRGQEGMSKREAELENIRELQRREGIPEESISASLRKATPKELEEEQLARSYETFVAQRRGDQAAAPEPAEAATAEQDKKEIASLSTPELKKQTKKQLSAVDTTAKKAQADANAGKIPQAVADDFKAQRDEAYRRYDEAKSRNEWLELAQILGQAVAQYGAAQVGMRTGRSMAGLQIPGVDYGARTAQEQKLLESRLRDISGEQERQDTLAERLRKQRMDEERMAMERRELSLKEREALLPKTDIEERQIRREERQAEKQDFQSRKTALQKAIGAQQIIASEATTPQAKKKAQEVVAEESAKAGIDLGAITEQSQVRGWFGRSSTDQQNILSLLRADLKALEESRQRGAAPATMQQQAPSGTVTVVHKPSGQSRQYPAGSPEVERAKSDPDFEVR